MQGVHRPRESLGVANLSKELKYCCCRSAGSRDFNTRKRLKGCRKGCVQEVSKKIEVVEKLRRSRSSNSLKDKHREVAIESLKGTRN